MAMPTFLEGQMDGLKLEVAKVEQQLAHLRVRDENSTKLVKAIEEKVRNLKAEMENLNNEFERVKAGLEANLQKLKPDDKKMEEYKSMKESLGADLQALKEVDMDLKKE